MNSFPANRPVDITILVKALNEEQHIEACLRSAQAALAAMPGLTGEVLLADSKSTDATVTIAAGLGVRIVQFENVADRGCGAALQLGYQYALGRYVYVLDGDMQMVPEFLPRAYQYLEQHPQVAGIGGALIDVHVRTQADRLRTAYYATLREEQEVVSLGGGGLYRREAVDRVGYLANRWLPAFEEAELAVRLRAAGYRLVRLGQPAILHSGHAENSLQMIRRLWRNRRIDASGMFLRGALGKPWFAEAVRLCWYVFAAPAVYALAVLLLLGGVAAGLSWPVLSAVVPVLWLVVTLVMCWRKRSVEGGVVAVLSWHAYAVGAVRGFLRPTADPMKRIAARELSETIAA